MARDVRIDSAFLQCYGSILAREEGDTAHWCIGTVVGRESELSLRLDASTVDSQDASVSASLLRLTAHLDEAKVQVAIARVAPPKHGRVAQVRAALITWCPSGVPGEMRSAYGRFRESLRRAFPGCSMHIDARAPEDVSLPVLMQRLANAGGDPTRAVQAEPPRAVQAAPEAPRTVCVPRPRTRVQTTSQWLLTKDPDNAAAISVQRPASDPRSRAPARDTATVTRNAAASVISVQPLPCNVSADRTGAHGQVAQSPQAGATVPRPLEDSRPVLQDAREATVSNEAPLPPPASSRNPGSLASKTATALYAYDATEDNEVSIVQGDAIVDVEAVPEAGDWLLGTVMRSRSRGYFPAAYARMDALS